MAIREILKKIKLSYNIGIQFKGGVFMEINPRLSTFMYTESWVEPYIAIKLALNEMTGKEIRALSKKIPIR